MMIAIGQPWFHRSPISALVSPSTEATDRSISRGDDDQRHRQRDQRDLRMSESIELRFAPLKKPRRDDAVEDRPSSRKTVTVSQRAERATRRFSHGRVLLLRSYARPIARRSAAAGRARSPQQQRAVDRLLPERVDLQHHQRGADRGQQQRAERRAVDRARAAEDRDAADHHRRDHLGSSMPLPAAASSVP